VGPGRRRGAAVLPAGHRARHHLLGHRERLPGRHIVVQAFDSPLDEPVVNAVQELAGTRGVTMAQVALAWVLRHPAVSAPIVGATKPHHLPEAVAALELKLTRDEAAALEKPYSNHGPSWY
jgi:1-deoxyxylulose-5-phosphate synthase